MRNKMFLAVVFASLAILIGPVFQAYAHSDDEEQDEMQCGCEEMHGDRGMMKGMHQGMSMMDGMEGMPMMDMGMGPGGHGMDDMKAVWMLDLNPDQRSKIRAVQDDLRRQNWTLMGKIMDEQTKLRDLYEADPLDAKKITPVYDSIFGLRKQMIAARINATNNVRGILTKEQREQLKQGETGCRGMGGHQMHHE